MRIACVLGKYFEDSEFEQPYNEFKKAGYEVTVIGTEAGQELKGKNKGLTVTTEKGIGEVSPQDFDALFIPGGSSPDTLRADDRMVEFAKAFFVNERPVFAICHGPQLLIPAGVLGGRKLTAWKTIQSDLKLIGGMDVLDEEVVVDGNLVTSRKPDDLPAFIRESMTILEKVPATV